MRSIAKTWYSPRGVRRGLGLAMLTTALWLSWAVGYVQGAAQTVASSMGNRMVWVDTSHPACNEGRGCS